MTRNAPPPRPELCGSTSPSAACTATAAWLPCRQFRIAGPAWTASGFAAPTPASPVAAPLVEIRGPVFSTAALQARAGGPQAERDEQWEAAARRRWGHAEHRRRTTDKLSLPRAMERNAATSPGTEHRRAIDPGRAHLEVGKASPARSAGLRRAPRSRRAGPGLIAPTSGSVNAAQAAPAVKPRSASAASGSGRAASRRAGDRRGPGASRRHTGRVGGPQLDRKSDPSGARTRRLQESAARRHAPASRTGRSRASAHGMSEVAWVGCIEAIDPEVAERGMSPSATTCACSTRQRWSLRGLRPSTCRRRSPSTLRLPRSPIAWVATCTPQSSRLDRWPPTRLSGRVTSIPRLPRIVAVVLQQRRAPLAQRAVGVDLHASIADGARTGPGRARRAQSGSARHVSVGVGDDAQGRLALVRETPV